MNPYRESLKDHNYAYLERLMQRCNNNVTQAARVAGVHRSTLYEMASECGYKIQGQGHREKIAEGNSEWRILS